MVTDLHEITNVCGLDGMRFVLDSMKDVPMDILPMVPSCVPATELETAGASIGIEEIRQMLSEYNIIGLGEMMNYPGVISASPNVLNKISCFSERVIDGHAPSVHGKELNAYIAAGVSSDHESTAFAEGMEKLEKGMYLMIREGSSEKNLAALLPLVTDSTWHRCMFVVDDRNCFDLFNEGDVDAVLRKAIMQGLDPIRAIQMATINPAQYFRLHDRGAVAAGHLANCMTFKDLRKLDVDMVFYRGELVAKDGTILKSLPEITSGLEKSIVMKKPSFPDPVSYTHLRAHET